ncbi:MAG: ribonuclease P protein component [Rhodobacteraceae bacterium]|nr:ribonuclease P protein component [Paracoccaceae bacterium]MCY4249133.1 ribonuclease P protein component [Paracoccaceae bacterium]MCY4308411.1 ribonuclease P protein component [Paracoccaceae bacterium]
MKVEGREENRRKIISLKKRKEFLKLATGLKWHTRGFLIQGLPREAIENDSAIRLGITCSRKLGNAVTRNRAKRRLRHLAHDILPHFGELGWDYVLIGFRNTTVNMNFEDMGQDLKWALDRIHHGAKVKDGNERSGKI